MFEIIKKLFKRKNEFPVKIIQTEKGLIFKDKSGKAIIQLINTGNNFVVNICTDLIFSVNGKGTFNINGDTNFVSYGDTNIDTWKSKLNINSRKASQIHNKKEAIAFREEAEKFVLKFEKWKENNKEKIAGAIDENMNDNNKIEGEI